MDKFIVSQWFEKRAALNIQTFELEGVVFELMALDQDLKEQIECCDTYDEMLALAANSGISYNRKRVADDVELSKDLDLLWGQPSMDVDSDPCIQYRVGEKVCEISGITSIIEEKLNEEARSKQEAEKASIEGYIDGDHQDGNPVTLEGLNDDLQAYNATQNL